MIKRNLLCLLLLLLPGFVQAMESTDSTGPSGKRIRLSQLTGNEPIFTGTNTGDQSVLRLSNEFLKACVIGDVPQVIKCFQGPIKSVARIQDDSNSDKIGALHIAAAYGKQQVVEQLINYGLDINAPDGRCMTPLHHALLNRHTETAQLLLENGARDFNYDSFDNTVYDYAVLTSDDALIHHIGEMMCDDKGRNFLHLAVLEDDFFLVKNLLSHHISANCKDNRGNTPLYYACKQGNMEIMELLLLAHASPGALPSWFKRKLLERNKNVDLVKLLLASTPTKKFWVTVQDMYKLILMKKDKMLTLILQDTRIIDLFIRNWSDIVIAFLKECLNINPQLAFALNDDGRPALLTKAFQMQNWDIVILLLNHGARDKEVFQQYTQWLLRLLEFEEYHYGLLNTIAVESEEIAAQIKKFKNNPALSIALANGESVHTVVSLLMARNIKYEVVAGSSIVRLIGSPDNASDIITEARSVKNFLATDAVLNF